MEKKEIVFVDGASLRKLSDKAPDFIKAKIDINAKKFTDWLRANAKPNDKGDWWATIDIRQSQKGTLYLCLDDFVRDNQQQTNQVQQTKPTQEEKVIKTVEYQTVGITEKDTSGFGKEIDVSKIPF